MLFKLITTIDDNKKIIPFTLSVTKENIVRSSNYMLHYKLYNTSGNLLGFIDIIVRDAHIWIDLMKNLCGYHNVGRALHEIAFKLSVATNHTGKILISASWQSLFFHMRCGFIAYVDDKQFNWSSFTIHCGALISELPTANHQLVDFSQFLIYRFKKENPGFKNSAINNITDTNDHFKNVLS